MQAALLIWVLLFAFVGARFADYLNRILSPDMAAVAFAEGGDDAYYYFSVARNIGKGLGATIDGEHWTTGFQPLWQLLTGLSFIAGSDRAAFAIIYLLSFSCWAAGLFLFVRFVRRASPVPTTPLATALLAVLFLCEVQLNLNYFNGLDTGLYLTLCLALLTAFQHHLQSAPAIASPARLVGIGVLAGTFMLARNDGVFLCAALLSATLVRGARPRPFREGLIIVATASVLVVPWLIYCQVVWGYPMPQSGVATSTAIYGQVPWQDILRYLVTSVVPTFFLKTRTFIDTLPLSVLVAAVIVATVLATYWRSRDRSPAVERSSRLVLIALAGACIMLVLYYSIVSSVGQFFVRYFVPIKLLVLILLSLFLLRAWQHLQRKRVATAAIVCLSVAAIGSNLYWTLRDHDLPYRSYMGYEAYHFPRSPYGKGPTLVGTPESGRLGFLDPTRVINLDGKGRVDALRAMQNNTMDTFMKDAGFDYLLLTDFYVNRFDKLSPAWRKTFHQVDRLGIFNVYANAAKGH
jgi:hypothetical protein